MGGHEALRILREAVTEGHPYDIALLDVEMPEMDGLTLARMIKAEPALAVARLIALTPLGHALTPEEMHSAGIDAVLSKPVKHSRLFDCLVGVIGKSEASSLSLQKAGVPPPPPLSRELQTLLDGAHPARRGQRREPKGRDRTAEKARLFR